MQAWGKIVSCIWRILFFFSHHNFMKKVHSQLSKNEPENIPYSKSPFWYFFKPRKVGRIRAVLGNCLKYLKRGWNRKEGRENKDFKKGGILDQGVGALIRGGDWSTFTNYDFEHISYRFLLLLLLTFNRYMFVGKKH